MKFASVAEVKDKLSAYLQEAHRCQEPVLITHHGKPYAMLRPLTARDLEQLEWRQLAEASLKRAWEGEEDRLYDYL